MGKAQKKASQQTRNNLCPHAKDKVNVNKLKTTLLRSTETLSCKDCLSKNTRSSLDRSVVCLKCGQIFCDASQQDHATVHSEKKGHFLVTHFKTLKCWCFKCGKDLAPLDHPKVAECFELLKENRQQLLLAGNESRSQSTVSAPVSPTDSINFKYHTTQSHFRGASLGSASPVKGLRNVGNTCYFNSVMQCLSRLQLLHDALNALYSETSFPSEPIQTINDVQMGSLTQIASKIQVVPMQSYAKALELKEKLQPILLDRSPPHGKLGSAMLTFIDDMTAPIGTTSDPVPILRLVCERAPRFRGRHQQDSQELLSTVLDALDEEEKERSRLSLLESFGLDYDQSKSLGMNIKDTDRQHQKEILVYNRSIRTYITGIFGGQLVSYVKCLNCEKITKTIDDVLDISLPLCRSTSQITNDTSHKKSAQSKSSPQKKSKKPKNSKKERKQDKKKSGKKSESRSNSQSTSDSQLPKSQIDSNQIETTSHDKTQPDLQLENKSDEYLELPSQDHPKNLHDIEDAEIKTTETEPETSPAKSQVDDLLMPIVPDKQDSENESVDVDSEDQNVREPAETSTSDFEFVDEVEGTEIVDGFESFNLDDDDNLDSRLSRTASKQSEGAGSGYLGFPSDEDENENDESQQPSSPNDSSRPHTPEISPTILLSDPEISPPKTAAPPYESKKLNELSLESCFAGFCQEEKLEGDNAFRCEHCSVAKNEDDEDIIERRPALKQLLLHECPRILVIHLKRFEQRGMRLVKMNDHVEFPLVLDIAPFTVASFPLSVYEEGETGIKYGLCGVVVHQGRGTLQFGHYVAYVKVGQDSDAAWYYVSDMHVKPVSVSDVLKSQAYLLFYERLH